MNKKIILGILSFLLLVLAVIFSMETPYMTAIGDTILKSIHLKPWSNGDTGLHYTFIYSVIMFIVGYYGTKKFLKHKYPKFVKKLPIIIFIIFIIYPILTSGMINVVKSNSDGLYAVHYMRDESQINYKSEDGYINIQGQIKLRNYSDDEKRFSIKYINNGPFMEEISIGNELVAVNQENNEEIFVLEPNATVIYKVNFKEEIKNDMLREGWSKDIDISIFDQKEEVKFYSGTVWGVVLNR